MLFIEVEHYADVVQFFFILDLILPDNYVNTAFHARENINLITSPFFDIGRKIQVTALSRELGQTVKFLLKFVQPPSLIIFFYQPFLLLIVCYNCL